MYYSNSFLLLFLLLFIKVVFVVLHSICWFKLWNHWILFSEDALNCSKSHSKDCVLLEAQGTNHYTMEQFGPKFQKIIRGRTWGNTQKNQASKAGLNNIHNDMMHTKKSNNINQSSQTSRSIDIGKKPHKVIQTWVRDTQKICLNKISSRLSKDKQMQALYIYTHSNKPATGDIIELIMNRKSGGSCGRSCVLCFPLMDRQEDQPSLPRVKVLCLM